MPAKKITNSLEHNRNKQENLDRSQWGTLMVTLWMARLFGVAPVSFKKNLPECPVKVSKAGAFYSKLFMLLMHVGIVIGTLKDWQGGSQSIRVQDGWSCFNWLSELIIYVLITTVGAFGAPERLSRTFAYLDTIEKVQSKITSSRFRKFPWKSTFGTILYTISVIALYALDFYIYYYDGIIDGKDYTVMYFYLCFYVEAVTLLLLELEFMWVAMFVHAGLEAVNKAMEGLIFFIDVQRKYFFILLLLMDGSSTSVPVDGLLEKEMFYIPRPVERFNTIVDRMPTQCFIADSQDSHTSKYIPESIRRISHSYGIICEVIAGINENYGLLLVLNVASFILHFIVTPFYFFNNMYSNNPRSGKMTEEIIFVLYHFSFMLILVEPGYLTEKQNEYTKTLTRQLLLRASFPKDPMIAELDILLKHIDLNKVCYSPLKLCRLTRSLITVILSGATTYLVVILQFQRMK